MLITFNKICLVLTYNAEWCAANGEKKGEMGGGEERAVAGTFSLAAHLPPCSLRQAPPFRGERSEQAESPAGIPAHINAKKTEPFRVPFSIFLFGYRTIFS